MPIHSYSPSLVVEADEAQVLEPVALRSVIGKITVPESVAVGWRWTVTGPPGSAVGSCARGRGGREGRLGPQRRSSPSRRDDAFAEGDRADVPFADRAQRHDEAHRAAVHARSGRDAARRWGSSAPPRHSYIRGRNRRRSAALARRRIRRALRPNCASISSKRVRTRSVCQCRASKSRSTRSSSARDLRRPARAPPRPAARDRLRVASFACQARWNGRTTTREGSA